MFHPGHNEIDNPKHQKTAHQHHKAGRFLSLETGDKYLPDKGDQGQFHKDPYVENAALQVLYFGLQELNHHPQYQQGAQRPDKAEFQVAGNCLVYIMSQQTYHTNSQYQQPNGQKQVEAVQQPF